LHQRNITMGRIIIPFMMHSGISTYFTAGFSRLCRLSREGSWVVMGQAATVIGSLAGVRLLSELLDPAAYGELALGMTAAGQPPRLFECFPQVGSTGNRRHRPVGHPFDLRPDSVRNNGKDCGLGIGLFGIRHSQRPQCNPQRYPKRHTPKSACGSSTRDRILGQVSHRHGNAPVAESVKRSCHGRFRYRGRRRPRIAIYQLFRHSRSSGC